MIIITILILIFMGLFAYSACVMSSRCSREEERYYMKEKVYVIVDESIWNYDANLEIVAASKDQNTIKELFKKHVDKIKDDIDFNTLIEDDDYIYDDSDERFSIYLDGEFNDKHIEVSIYGKELINDLESDLEK